MVRVERDEGRDTEGGVLSVVHLEGLVMGQVLDLPGNVVGHDWDSSSRRTADAQGPGIGLVGWKVVMILYGYVLQQGDACKWGTGIGDIVSESDQEIVYSFMFVFGGRALWNSLRM